MLNDRDGLLPALLDEHRLLEQLRRRYSQLVLLTESAEYRCLPKALDDIASLEAELGVAELIRAVACQPLQAGSAETTGEDGLSASSDQHRVDRLLTELRRLYLEVSSYRTMALRATDARLAELAEA